MKKFVYISIIGILIASSCSTRKNSLVNRKYHGMTSKYNVLYNGNLALDEGIKGLSNQYKDDYWKVLPIEPLHIDEETPLTIPGEGDNENKSKTPFEIAEEKAVKAVQKHGMYINGVEHNKQTDAAYLLLGKARYYSQRFVPALEAFDFLLKNFQNDNLSNDLRIWKAKTQIRLQNEDRAIKTLRNLLSYKDIKGETKENAHTALAMAYLTIDSTSLAIKQLNFATETQYNKDQHARNLFVLGQLLRQEGQIDSSQLAFKKIIKFNKSPEKYKMHAYIEQAKNITDSTDYKELQKEYKKLIKRYENKNYLGELYYQMALMDFRDGNDSIALANLTNSTHTPSVEPYQMSLSYEKAGDYYFDKSKFVTAGAFYDTVLVAVDNDNTKRVRKLKRKRKSLDELISYETLLKNNDSILALVAMDESSRVAYFKNYIAKIKEADDIAAIQKENQERANSGGFGMPGGLKSSDTPNGKWYFYIPQTVGFGKANFQKIWGDRTLKDNWRLSGESPTENESSIVSDDKTNLSGKKSIDNTKKYDLDHYLSLIPKDEKVITKMHKDNSDALYQLGLIYKEKFKDFDLATNRFERFLSEKPIEKYILPAKYHLYKIYSETKNPKLSKIKNEIIAEYPDSRFSQIIKNPEEASEKGEKKKSELHYEKVYCDYEFEKYNSVIEQCNTAIKQYPNDPIQRKFDLLKSYAIYKTEGKKPFMTNLEYVTVNYPKTEEAVHAQDMLDFLNGVKKKKEEEKSEIRLPSRGKGKNRNMRSNPRRPGGRSNENPNEQSRKNDSRNRSQDQSNKNQRSNNKKNNWKNNSKKNPRNNDGQNSSNGSSNMKG